MPPPIRRWIILGTDGMAVILRSGRWPCVFAVIREKLVHWGHALRGTANNNLPVIIRDFLDGTKAVGRVQKRSMWSGYSWLKRVLDSPGDRASEATTALGGGAGSSGESGGALPSLEKRAAGELSSMSRTETISFH